MATAKPVPLKKPEDPSVVVVSCSQCKHPYAKFAVLPSGELGLRQYTCQNCRYTWTVAMGGPLLNF